MSEGRVTSRGHDLSRGRTVKRGRHGLFGKRALLFLIPGAVYLAVLSIYPLIDLFRTAFADVTAANILGGRPFNGLDNAQAVLDDPAFLGIVVQTLVVVAIVLVVSLGGGFLAALVLRPRTRLSAITLGFMVFVWTLPPVVSGNLWKFLLSSDGAINTTLIALHLIDKPLPWLSQGTLALVVLALVNAWTIVPFCALVIRAALLDVPEELLEAAAIDGASGWKANRYIVLPLLRPVLSILSVLVVINAFRSFDLIFVMTAGGPGTATTTLPFLSYQQAFHFYEFGQGAFTALLSLLIVLGLAAVYIRANRKETQ
ncbi:carbohydrate ABC transporter permease [Leifsonia poae]|uniref:carbohydrate ABC transporter permease n=1 Tax=Leifsonia poae TaxID=110933 RepID=UPI001CBB92AE|nr:sugar ABC transporter permease [Leifsonia poae]